jgi:DNA repair protein RadC
MVSKESLAPSDRPREKLSRLGPSALTETELIAVLLGSGSRVSGVLQVARAAAEALRTSGMHVSLEQLAGLPGLGAAKACSILASLELARRVLAPRGPKLECARDVYVVANGLRTKRQEQFVVMTADADCNLLRRRTVFVGTLDASLVHPREVFAAAIADRAAFVFVAHNHPSGNQKPSAADIAATRRIVEAGRMLGIEVRDHVIVTANGYFSFREHDLL